MKLRNLNGAIRKNDGPPKLSLATAYGPVVVSLVKSDLIAGLAALHPDSSAETGLTIVNGELVHEGDLERMAARQVREDVLILGVEDRDETIDLEDAIASAPAAPVDDDLLGLL